MVEQLIGIVLCPLAIFGGISLIIRTISRARLERFKIERSGGQTLHQDDAVVRELQALKAQMSQMQDTSHQFDISFDQALNRLEARVHYLEASRTVQNSAAPIPPQQQVGIGDKQ